MFASGEGGEEARRKSDVSARAVVASASDEREQRQCVHRHVVRQGRSAESVDADSDHRPRQIRTCGAFCERRGFNEVG